MGQFCSDVRLSLQGSWQISVTRQRMCRNLCTTCACACCELYHLHTPFRVPWRASRTCGAATRKSKAAAKRATFWLASTHGLGAPSRVLKDSEVGQQLIKPECHASVCSAAAPP